MLSPDAVITAARSAIGTPFVAQGRSPEEGMDCTGLVLWSFLQAGWQPAAPEVTLERKYRIVNDGRQLLRVVRAECVQIATDPQPADIVLLRWKPDGHPMHCALVTKTTPLYIIHTSLDTMKVSEHQLDARKQWMLHSAWRCKALC